MTYLTVSPGHWCPVVTKLRSDFSLIDKSEHTHPAWESFVLEMTGRAYGFEALHTAWYWFKAGWVADGIAPNTPNG